MTGDGERDRLRAYLTSLEAAWAEFEHQARRHRDALERAGGILGSSEAEARRLARNIADNEREQARVRARLTELKNDE